MSFCWHDSVPRIPDADWTRRPVEELARGYDTVEGHGWYRNLDHTLDQLDAALKAGDLLVDYSGGTGILADRLLERLGGREVGVLIVDSSPKFLRLALEKFRHEPRVGFRRIRYLKDEGRLEALEEALEPDLLQRGADALEAAGFEVLSVERRPVEARVEEWYEFLSVYHEGVLGWVGGAEKVTGEAPAEKAVEDRLRLMRQATERVFGGEDAFPACWTYLTCAPQG